MQIQFEWVWTNEYKLKSTVKAESVIEAKIIALKVFTYVGLC